MRAIKNRRSRVPNAVFARIATPLSLSLDPHKSEDLISKAYFRLYRPNSGRTVSKMWLISTVRVESW
jgi:hypothetical protein